MCITYMYEMYTYELYISTLINISGKWLIKTL